VVHAVVDDIGALVVVGIQHERAFLWGNRIGLDIRSARSYFELLHGRDVRTRYSGKPSRRAC